MTFLLDIAARPRGDGHVDRPITIETIFSADGDFARKGLLTLVAGSGSVVLSHRAGCGPQRLVYAPLPRTRHGAAPKSTSEECARIAFVTSGSLIDPRQSRKPDFRISVSTV